ncbi:translation elongation factor 1-beta, putative [Bodo saltans]|uniref:Translation elongation factor 1-beta, putative n=1 Tax=Bodo saltans TaxID=75058 RepID=A0A0S4JK70_BODSA|nr:translation elongation factor 1-beta, putative [Bodo saltans]|eukprot:CUG90357.1 translation elongation factor 1-beta, putative [Bodo saltans]
MATKADVLKKSGELDAKLKGKMFLGGAKPTAEDVKAFNDLLGAGNNNIYRWVKNLASYTEAERKAFGAAVKVTAPVEQVIAAAAAAPAAPAAAAAPAKKEEPKKEEPKKVEAKPAAPAADSDDDVDLFGEETEEDKAALEAKKKADAEKKKEKKVVIAKSSILIDIKPWDDTTDLKELAAKLHAIEKDGLIWGDHKFVAIAFGIKKLQQLIVIEDDKVSGDDLEEMITGFEDHVQSMDIVAWNKI